MPKTNERFRSYVTSTAFTLILSDKMIFVILYHYYYKDHIESGDCIEWDVSVSKTLRALSRRGIIHRGAWKLTKVGISIAEMLEGAGFTLDDKYGYAYIRTFKDGSIMGKRKTGIEFKLNRGE